MGTRSRSADSVSRIVPKKLPHRPKTFPRESNVFPRTIETVAMWSANASESETTTPDQTDRFATGLITLSAKTRN